MRQTSKSELDVVYRVGLISKCAWESVNDVYKSSNYPDNIGLAETRVLIRKTVHAGLCVVWTQLLQTYMRISIHACAYGCIKGTWSHSHSFHGMCMDVCCWILCTVILATALGSALLVQCWELVHFPQLLVQTSGCWAAHLLRLEGGSSAEGRWQIVDSLSRSGIDATRNSNGIGKLNFTIPRFHVVTISYS